MHTKEAPAPGKPGEHKCSHCGEIIDEMPTSFHTPGKPDVHYHPRCAKHRPGGPGGISVRIWTSGEDSWEAEVNHRGALYRLHYAPGDAKDGYDPDTGAPTEAVVREDWENARSEFRLVK